MLAVLFSSTNILKEDVVKVLLVDDEILVIKALQRSFRKSSYEIFFALNAFEAEEILNQGNFDVLMTDNDMPQKTGVELIKTVLNSDLGKKNPNLIIILFSGKIKPDDLPENVEFIYKPWDDQKLKEKFREIQKQKEA